MSTSMTQESGPEIEPPHSLVDEALRRPQPKTSPRIPDRAATTPVPGPDKSVARRGPRVSKTMVNFIVDTMLLVLVVSLLFTAAVLRFVFPAPSTSAGWMLWGRGYDAWANFQFVVVSIVGLAILLHVMLHWSWVCGVIVTKLLGRSGTKNTLDEGQQTLWGVGMLIVVVNLLGLLIGLAYLTIQSPAP
jgi:hypothetical protein